MEAAAISTANTSRLPCQLAIVWLGLVAAIDAAAQYDEPEIAAAAKASAVEEASDRKTNPSSESTQNKLTEEAPEASAAPVAPVAPEAPEVVDEPTVPDKHSGSDVRGDPAQEELAREAERAFDMFLRDQKILFLKGEIEFELGFSSSAETRNNVRFNNLIVPTLSSESATVSLLVRYALTDDLEINLSVPASANATDYDFLFLDAPGAGFDDIQHSGMGDVEAGFRFQWLREEGIRPDVALSVSYKSDTGADGVGSNDDSVRLKTTVVKTIDPAVFFLELGYEFTRENNGLDRGDAMFAQFGTGFSLNDRVSYNVQYALRSIDEFQSGDIQIRGTDRRIASLQFGSTIRLSRNVYFEPFLGIGLTDDANDVSFGFSVPF